MSATAPRTGTVREARPGAVRRRSATRSRAAAYLLVRVTGVMLAVLVLGHFLITHILTDVSDTGSAFIDRRWGSALWLAWDWTMLGAALAHGGAGVWVLIDDFTAHARRRRIRRQALVAVCTVLWVIGSILIAAAIF
jgi:succinate dehydrogenase hydrophobic anchor subunit